MKNDANDREVIVPEPKDGRWRMAIPVVGIAWILLHLLIPSRYYAAGADIYDERFSWRMFSSVRVRHCELVVTETTATGARALALMEFLPAPWVSLLERNRPAVLERFLRWRCAHEGTQTLRFVNTCSDTTGDALPAIERSIDCESGEIAAPEADAVPEDGAGE